MTIATVAIRPPGAKGGIRSCAPSTTGQDSAVRRMPTMDISPDISQMKPITYSVSTLVVALKLYVLSVNTGAQKVLPQKVFRKLLMEKRPTEARRQHWQGNV